ncbi:MAG TPA: FG-GAP repeat protein, partial [Pirellulales bacterium]|nr:FG-GAP repeat protein [Pirellulales bacterium]
LTASDSANGDDFGAAVAIDGNLVVVGDPNGNVPVPMEYQATQATYVNAGEAFVYNLTTAAAPVLEALLTETDGLSEADAAAVGQQAGDKFGSAVAIAGTGTTGYYVVVGASGYKNDTGAAYAFYRLPDQGSGNGPSWTRSTGSSGSGQLTPAAPQGADPGQGAPLAGEFGGSVVVGNVLSSGGRIVVGMEGYNQTNASNVITAANAGAVRTYTTDSTLPSTTAPNLDAEILDGPQGQTTFGQDTVYDPTTRTLFVAAPPAAGSAGGSVEVYLNEGLYWSFVETLTAPTADSGFAQFGYALAVSGDTLVIGAPSSNSSNNGMVLIYTFSAGTWPSQPTQTITGASYDFGYSIAINGSNLVVGSPQETIGYSSSGQGDQTSGDEITGLPANSPYRLDLTASGAAYTYQLSAGTWTLSNLLMPDDTNLPDDTSTPEAYVLEDGTATFNYNSDAQSFTSADGTQSAGTDTFTTNYYYDFYEVELGPRTSVALNSIGEGISNDSHSTTIYNYSYTQYKTFQFSSSDPSGDLSDWQYRTDGIGIVTAGTNSFTVSIITPQAQDATYAGLNNAGWGSSVAIVGNTVAVGAPGVSGVAIYDLGGSTYSHWTAYGPEVSGGTAPLTPFNYQNQTSTNTGLGTIVALQGTQSGLNAGNGQLFAGAPNANSNAGADYAYSISGFSLSSPSAFSSGTGVAGSIAVAGNREIMGAPSGVGDASLYNANSGNSLNLTLTPFKFDSNTSTETAETANVQFGVGASLISEGFYMVGGPNSATVNSGTGAADSGLLYDFRQRGPSWTPVAQTVTLDSFLANDTFTLQFSAATFTTLTGVTVAGSSTITGLVSTSSLAVGEAVTGTDLSGGTYTIANILSPTSIALNTGIGITADANAVINVENPITTGTTGPIAVSSSTSTTAANIAAALNTLIGGFTNLTGLTANVSFVSGQTYAVSFAGTHANNVMPLVVGQVVSTNGTAQATSDLLSALQNQLAQAGSSVAISGTTFVAGAPKYDNSGAVFIYNYDSGTQQWVVQSVPLQPTDIQTYDNFGCSVALDGNTLVVGADNKANGAGAVYIFQYVGGQWMQVAEFQGQAGEQLGTSVGISGTEAIAGAQGSDKAYLYSFNGTAWIAQQTLTDTTIGSGFGSAVAIDGSTAVVGAPNANNVGTAYAYVLNNGTWSQQGNLGNLQTLSQGGGFGSAVAVSGGEIIVGAPDAGSLGSANIGAAYMFKVGSTGTWSVDGPPLQSLATLNAGDHFGAAVAIDGQQVVVGAYGANHDQGTAYSFSQNNSYWDLDSTTGLLPGGSQEGDMVGFAVALSGSNAVLGAPQQNGRTPFNSSAINTDGNGYAYIRNLSPPQTVTVPERQETLIQGAQTNVVVGTVGGMTTANLYFFDTPTVSVQTNAGTASVVTISSAGLTAFGLVNFSVNNVGTGNDTLNVNSNTLAAPAGGSFAPPLSFNPSSSNVTSDQITFPEQDNLITGQLVEYHDGTTGGAANSPIGGLTDGGVYYVTVVNPTTIELSLTLGGPAIEDLNPTQATGTGHFFDTRVEELAINTASAVANNEITFAQPDNLVNQQTVVYHAGSTNGTPDTAIGNLTDGATYYVIVVNPTTIELSSSFGGNPIALDPTKATGTGHFLSAAVVLQGVFKYGGTGTNTLNVDPNNTDWTLSSTSLTDPQGNQLQLVNVTTVTLTGGAGSNTFTVDGWTKGTVTIDGGSGSNTYNVYTGGGASDVNVVDPNGTGVLNVFGDPTQKNQFTIETNSVVWNLAQTIGYTGIQTLTVTGQSLGDNFLEENSSAPQVYLVGVSGSDLFQVFQGTTQNTHVTVHGAVPAGVTDTDELDLPTSAVPSITIPNTYDLNNHETVTYDPTITVKTNITPFSATQTIDVPAGATVILQGQNLMINGTAYDLSQVTNLTLDGSGTTGGASFTIDSIPSTLTTLTLTGGGASSGNNTLAGPSTGANVWQITGTNSGQLLIGDSSTPLVTFTGMANLTGRSSADDFEFKNNGTTSTGKITGNLTGGGGELDDSGVSAAVTVNLGNGTATDIGGTLGGIANFVGNTAVSNTLAGPNAANAWQITTTN